MAFRLDGSTMFDFLRNRTLIAWLTASLFCVLAGCGLDDSGTSGDEGNEPTRLGDRTRSTPDVGVDSSATSSDANSDAATNSDVGAVGDGFNPEPTVADTTSGDQYNPAHDLCSEEAKRIYLVDGNNASLYGFDPMTNTFHFVTTLSCPTSSLWTPYSMAVSREAVAYVLYQDSSIYQVDTASGSCAATAFDPGFSLDWSLFGMGYAMNSRDATEDTLFIANASHLGSIDLADFSIRVVSTIEVGNAELSGTAWGDLWGFFPQATPPRVAQIDKTTGDFLTQYELPTLSSAANAWAFALWGGYAYIFYKSFTDSSTNVYRISLDGGTLETIVANSGRYIVGAGVSTCAPAKWPEEDE